jgi:hypothetical protein
VNQLRDILQIRLAWKDKFEGRTPPCFTEHSVYPEAEYPNGRKGLLLTRLWQNLNKPTSDGAIILDGDVIIDPHDYDSLITHACTDVNAVWTAPVKLWPSATSLTDWVWGHRKLVDMNRPQAEIVKEWQQDIDDPDMFTFCFTYLPAALINGAIRKGLDTRMYPKVDWFMWETAQELGIPVRVVRDCYPRHLNY